ncbi:MAG TPA: tripartite tricarboxylate transporter substrate binding protein [Xanthobacteraceae bacterium]|jgi:tripartite-type tricarboxylate transporter receptor subunit TctC
MRFSRRQFVHLAASATALSAMSCIARAQPYPSRPVRIVVGFPAGGTSDIVARVLGQWLTERLGQQFVVENRPGAGSNLATEAVARATPDGYTLLLVGGANTINATMFDKLTFDFLHDIAPVASVFETPLVVEVNPSVPARSIPELVTYAKDNPGKLNFATPGVGTPPHVAGELFKMTAGLNFVHVPYRGTGPMLTDLIGGQVQVAFDPLPASIEHIRAGNLRALAVTTASRSEALPNVPSVSEHLPGYVASNWYGFAAPKGTPLEIVGKLNAEINAALADPKVKARFTELGGTPLSSSPAEFVKFVADDTAKWAKVIKAANIKPE